MKLLIISFSPIPTLKWYRVNYVTNTDKEINGSDYRLLRFNQVLKITNVGADKAGKYKCVARNPEGLKDEVSGAVKVVGNCRILPVYLHWTTTFKISFSGSSETNHGSLL